MKGGARPGAGRKKGQKDTKPRKGTEAHAEAEKIKAMLTAGAEARKKLYYDFLVRVKRGEKLTAPEIKLMDQIGGELAEGMGGKPQPAKADLDAADYLRQAWNDPSLDPALRIRAAEVFIRGAGDPKGGKGKKDVEKDRAAEAGKGRLASMANRLKVVK